MASDPEARLTWTRAWREKILKEQSKKNEKPNYLSTEKRLAGLAIVFLKEPIEGNTNPKEILKNSDDAEVQVQRSRVDGSKSGKTKITFDRETLGWSRHTANSFKFSWLSNGMRNREKFRRLQKMVWVANCCRGCFRKSRKIRTILRLRRSNVPRTFVGVKKTTSTWWSRETTDLKVRYLVTFWIITLVWTFRVKLNR